MPVSLCSGNREHTAARGELNLSCELMMMQIVFLLSRLSSC